MSDDTDLTRRQLLGVAAGAVVAAPLLTSAVVEAAAANGLFFTQTEFALVDELSELILPTDEHSPGARAAQVAAYLDARLAEAIDNDIRVRWRTGLKAIDDAAKTRFGGRNLLSCHEAERIELLTAIAAREANPTTVPETFFAELKQQVVRGYYTSSIGIHKEMEYKGNSLLQEFVGVDVSKDGTR